MLGAVFFPCLILPLVLPGIRVSLVFPLSSPLSFPLSPGSSLNCHEPPFAEGNHIRDKLLNIQTQEEKPQGLLYNLITPQLYPTCLEYLLTTRIQDYAVRHFPEHANSLAWHTIPAVIDMLRTHAFRPLINSLLIRTFCNCWMTGSRMPQGHGILNCVFHCSGKSAVDPLTHYLECPVLWKLVQHVF